MVRIAGILLGLLASVGAFGFEKPSFPRLASIAIGGPQNYEDPARQTQLARFDMMVLSVWPGFDGGRAQSMEQIVRGIKGRNPASLVFLYVANNELDDQATAWSELRNKIDQNGWWLYANGGGGSRVKSTFGTSHYILNNTPQSNVDAATGQRFPEWFAKYAADKFYSSAPSIDGFFLDNVFWKPRVNGDWNRDGSTDSQNDAAAQLWMRQGLRQHFDTMRQRMPGKFQIGNIADWGASEASLSELSGAANGGVMEGIVGPSWAVETWAGWQQMMSWYRKGMGALAEPKLFVFGQTGNPYNYREFRYGFTSCLLDDGYYAFNQGSAAGEDYHTVYWFDEFDAELGRALSGPSSSPWRNGIYRRDFERGIVLVNPKGNGSQEVELEADFRRIAGSQDSSVNNGQLARRVRIEDRDGIVLLRLEARAVPTPPTGLRVE